MNRGHGGAVNTYSPINSTQFFIEAHVKTNNSQSRDNHEGAKERTNKQKHLNGREKINSLSQYLIQYLKNHFPKGVVERGT